MDILTNFFEYSLILFTLTKLFPFVPNRPVLIGHRGLLHVQKAVFEWNEINLLVYCIKGQRRVYEEDIGSVIYVLHHLSDLLLLSLNIYYPCRVFPHFLIDRIVFYPSEVAFLNITKG